MKSNNNESFKKIDIQSYWKECESNIKYAKKIANVAARRAELGEKITTKTSNNFEETHNTAKVGDWIITNPGGEEYIISGEEFSKKYDLVDVEAQLYQSKGIPMSIIQICENIEFAAPWGETMRIKSGGFLINNGGNDIYGIQEQEFHNTYKPCDKDGELLPDEKLQGITIDAVHQSTRSHG